MVGESSAAHAIRLPGEFGFCSPASSGRRREAIATLDGLAEPRATSKRERRR
ncbi:hypothetical protein SAMN02745121_06648 [Nannocystis exedens]|uniref:Uncharacterized protein n=1 Tax=Nannocystis exedens TaxID=54 RepID=A0A1I2FHI3_9BACT|nr:hypothetical protein [Nannocystis exedens]PCC70444.1 hypothetical protein NAEX_03487 [Nannocystis exedens]SFF04218.1 hypothetical protein SAMN02745121_06648 [Nannocystis exedens]